MGVVNIVVIFYLRYQCTYILADSANKYMHLKTHVYGVMMAGLNVHTEVTINRFIINRFLQLVLVL